MSSLSRTAQIPGDCWPIETLTRSPGDGLTTASEIRVLGAGESQTHYRPDQWNDMTVSAGRVSGREAFGLAGVTPQDVDVFRFEGRAGQRVVAEVLAARLGSPVDSFLTVYDAQGRVLAANDDHGGSMLRRMQTFVNALVAQCKRFALPAELIVVEWNPPAGRPPLAEVLRWPENRM